jgi:hypothetical protein
VILALSRDYRDPTCTLGVLEAFGRRLQTMERPWVPDPAAKAGRKGVSCILPGKYRLFPHSTDAHKDVWALTNPLLDVYHWESDVPPQRRGLARTTVLIHPANYASELRGCIAPGKERRKVSQLEWSVQRSRDAMNELHQWVNGALDLWIEINEERLPEAQRAPAAPANGVPTI